MSPVKEPNFFSITNIPEDHYLKPIRNTEKYLSLFNGVLNEKIFGEATTLYLSDPKTPNLILKKSPNAKILISLRDPVERLFSNYIMLVNNGWFNESFHDKIQNMLQNNQVYITPYFRLDTSFYLEDVKRYLEIFGSKQVKIIIFEEFILDTKKTLKNIVDFLGLKNSDIRFKNVIHNPAELRSPRGKIAEQILASENVHKIVRRIIPTNVKQFLQNKVLKEKKPLPKLEQEDRDALIEFYKNDVKKLKEMLGRKLPWKHF